MTQPLADYQTRVEAVLNTALTCADTPTHLLDAMRYSTLGGGKRVRALLVYAAGAALGAPLARLDAVAAALECVHAYSLIHDDLPAMDDDDLRRGKATNHIAFDEPTAILAGDALQTLAFSLICAHSSQLTDAQCRRISQLLSRAAGSSGMVGGQMLDMLATGQSLSRADLESIHRGKTGALIRAAVLCGAHCADQVDDDSIAALQGYAEKLGLAFQIIDDVLDVEATTEQLGKQSGADAAQGKTTYPDLLGLQESRQIAENLYHEAVASVALIGDNNEQLLDVAALIVKRQF